MFEDVIKCNLEGCLYNKDGICSWEGALIQMTCARACDNEADPYHLWEE